MTYLKHLKGQQEPTFFQIGTEDFSALIANPTASNESTRCSEDTAITTLISITGTTLLNEMNRFYCFLLTLKNGYKNALICHTFFISNDQFHQMHFVHVTFIIKASNFN